MHNWTIEDAEKLYRINDWGNGYFHISDAGEVEVSLKDKSPQSSISLLSIVKACRIGPQAFRFCCASPISWMTASSTSMSVF